MTSRYTPELVKFMSYKDGVKYSNGHKFTPEDLLRIMPSDLCRWMNQRAYGDPNPDGDMRPVHLRSSSLEFAKKAISSFMPLSNSTWDPILNRGNPTRSDAVNKLIKRVRTFEVRREGAESQARRSVEYDEFMNLLLLVRAQWGQSAEAYMVSSVLALQWHICARIDDMMKLQFNNFSPNTQYTSTILIQMRWSKNIREERDAPEQIIIGSMDPKMCAILNLAVYVETATDVTSSHFVYGNPKDGDRTVRRFLADMVKNESFKKMKAGKLGTHSLRKGAATYATRSGVSKEFVNLRGRWRTRKGTVDIYIDNTQPYPDAFTAATLAGPAGPCFYTLKNGIECITPALLVDQVAPTVKQLMGESISTTLALALLWAALEPPDGYNFPLLPSILKEKIVRAYTRAGGNPDLNPVERDEIYVTGDGSQLTLSIINSNDATEQENDATSNIRQGSHVGPRGGGESSRREFAALHSQIAAARRQTTEVMTEVQQPRREHQRDLQKLHAIVSRLVMQPAFRQDTTIRNVEPHLPPNSISQRVCAARLSKRPKDLFELWREYQIGCGQLKPAKDFTAVERGANKCAYSRRKVFWDQVSNLVRAGFTSDTAIDKVYAVYGRNLSVSNILVALRADRKRGGHPGLRV